jgi:hypothetical protein
MYTKASIVVVVALLIVLSTPPVQAGPFGGGAMRGAMIGSLVNGRQGARRGAVIGGLMGAGEAASRRKKQKQAQRREAEWEAQQQAEANRIRQQQVAAAPQQAANQTLLVETQKSLIRLGHDPGVLGSDGPNLTNAILSYQRDKGLLETGELSQALLTHMLRNGG